MKRNVFPSNLPIVDKPGEMSFWQSMGISSAIISCHSVFSSSSVDDVFLSFQSALERQQAIILFNEENRPVAFATYFLSENIEEYYDGNNQLNIENGSLLFEYIVSPFSCPLHFYRFLKQHLETLSIDSNKAYLLKKSENSLRKIW